MQGLPVQRRHPPPLRGAGRAQLGSNGDEWGLTSAPARRASPRSLPRHGIAGGSRENSPAPAPQRLPALLPPSTGRRCQRSWGCVKHLENKPGQLWEHRAGISSRSRNPSLEQLLGCHIPWVHMTAALSPALPTEPWQRDQRQQNLFLPCPCAQKASQKGEIAVRAPGATWLPGITPLQTQQHQHRAVAPLGAHPAGGDPAPCRIISRGSLLFHATP